MGGNPIELVIMRLYKANPRHSSEPIYESIYGKFKLSKTSTCKFS